jgi:hypothetical protein
MKSRIYMSQQGNKAVRDFKINNMSLAEGGKTYSQMNDKEKSEALIKVKEEGMKNAAKSLGLTETKAKQLMDQKGLNLRGDNLISLSGHLASQVMSDDKTMFSSLRQQSAEVKTSMTNAQVKETLKNLGSDDKRKDFLNDMKAGGISIRDSKTDIAKKIISTSRPQGVGKNSKSLGERFGESSIGGAYRRYQTTKELEKKGEIKSFKIEKPQDIKKFETGGEDGGVKSVAKTAANAGISTANAIKNSSISAINFAARAMIKRDDVDNEKIKKETAEKTINKESGEASQSGRRVDEKQLEKFESMAKVISLKESGASRAEVKEFKKEQKQKSASEKPDGNTTNLQ